MEKLRGFLALACATAIVTACGAEPHSTAPEGAPGPAAAVASATAFDCTTVSEIPQAECEALVALYQSTDGPNWTNSTGWLQTETPCDWFGVGCGGGSVRLLALRNNDLAGTIPAQLADLSQLRSLIVVSNELTGPLPSELGNLTELTALFAGGNQLTGTIPGELGNLSNLQGLSIGANEFTGSIPSELGNLGELRRLSLNINDLSGSIPTSLGSLAKLEQLRLSHNQLDGSIPSELGNLGHLWRLDLSMNDLTGSIPTELGNLSELEELVLWGNGLTGEIPPELGGLSKLRQLVLLVNQLSGSIPAELGNLSHLVALHLAGNQLTGMIPVELGSLSEIATSPFGAFRVDSNQLIGQVPLAVAEVGASADLFCHFGNNAGLFVPDLPEYQVLADADGLICGLPLVAPDDGLETQIEALATVGALNDGQAGSLLRKLDNARSQADAGRTGPALAQLDAIVQQVEDFMADGVLTVEQGSTLIDLALAVRATIAA